MNDDVLLEQAKTILRKADEPACHGGPLGHLIVILEVDTNRSMAACGRPPSSLKRPTAGH